MFVNVDHRNTLGFYVGNTAPDHGHILFKVSDQVGQDHIRNFERNRLGAGAGIRLPAAAGAFVAVVGDDAELASDQPPARLTGHLLAGEVFLALTALLRSLEFATCAEFLRVGLRLDVGSSAPRGRG